MLVLDQVETRYGRSIALHGISLHVDQGEFVAVIGPNGAGKSTMMLSIAGVLKPAAGSITFDGESLIGRAPERIVRDGIALVPEGRHIFATMSVHDNLLMGATAGRYSKGELGAEIERVLELFPALRQRTSASAGKLSGGEQQQLAIARALLSRPRVLLLDEPSLGLAPRVVDAVFDVLEKLSAEGITILLVEQNAAMAVEAADRTYVLRNGRIELHGKRDELVNMDSFESVYMGFAEGKAQS
ncbi:MAG: ABC transporter ATP-binding protein [Actinobacteria bacterium]|nr:ABC transporter ATP-binding protein [Actinomycetota bacterium]